MKAAVRELMTNYQIKTYLRLLGIRRSGIIEQSNRLSEFIIAEIISKIEHQQYNTKCSGCTKY